MFNHYFLYMLYVLIVECLPIFCKWYMGTYVGIQLFLDLFAFTTFVTSPLLLLGAARQSGQSLNILVS